MLILVVLLASCHKESIRPLRGRGGGINEALSTPSAFTQVREDLDMTRIPFWFPVHLIDIRKAWDLCEGTRVIALDVIEIGSTTNLVFGRSTGKDAFGRQQTQGWFVLKQGQKQVQFYTTQADWRSALEELGVTNAVVVEPLDAWRSYWTQGSP